MKTIAVIGYGYVGEAMTRFFKDHFNVLVYDVAPVKKDRKLDGAEYLSKKHKSYDRINREADLVVVCVPTPMSEDKTVDLSYVVDVIGSLDKKLVLIKSTVPPGTCEELDGINGCAVTFSPEYIGEGKYEVQWWKDKAYPHPTDMKKHDFQIFGGNRIDTTQVLEFFKTVLGPDPKYFQTTWRTAELCKYMENAWGATKVVFCNEFADISDRFGVDYDELRELWLLDGRVERMHTAVFKYKRGFGGKCYPKDVNGIVKQAEDKGYEANLLKAVLKVNDEIIERQENNDDLF